MKVAQIQASIVVLAHNQNPDIVTKDWLAQNKILTEAPLQFVHTLGFSSIETQSYSLLVDPQRVMARLKTINQDSLYGLRSMVKTFVEKMPQGQYRAIGINSKWQVHDEILADLLKTIFTGKPDLFESVIKEQFLVGGILCWRHGDFEVRLTGEPKAPNASLDFNFHSDVVRIDDLYERIDEFSAVMTYTNTIANGLLGGVK